MILFLDKQHNLKVDGSKRIGFVAENKVENLDIVIEDKTLLTKKPYLEFQLNEGRKLKSDELVFTENHLIYETPNTLLYENGFLKIQVILVDDENKIWKSNILSLIVDESILANEKVLDSIYNISQKIDEVREELEKRDTRQDTFVYNTLEDFINSIEYKFNEESKKYELISLFYNNKKILAEDIKLGADVFTKTESESDYWLSSLTSEIDNPLSFFTEQASKTMEDITIEEFENLEPQENVFYRINTNPDVTLFGKVGDETTSSFVLVSLNSINAFLEDNGSHCNIHYVNSLPENPEKFSFENKSNFSAYFNLSDNKLYLYVNDYEFTNLKAIKIVIIALEVETKGAFDAFLTLINSIHFDFNGVCKNTDDIIQLYQEEFISNPGENNIVEKNIVLDNYFLGYYKNGEWHWLEKQLNFYNISKDDKFDETTGLYLQNIITKEQGDLIHKYKVDLNIFKSVQGTKGVIVNEFKYQNMGSIDTKFFGANDIKVDYFITIDGVSIAGYDSENKRYDFETVGFKYLTTDDSNTLKALIDKKANQSDLESLESDVTNLASYTITSKEKITEIPNITFSDEPLQLSDYFESSSINSFIEKPDKTYIVENKQLYSFIGKSKDNNSQCWYIGVDTDTQKYLNYLCIDIEKKQILFKNSYDLIPDKITVDNSFDDNSENPVQNKVITEKVNSIDNSITDISETLDSFGKMLEPYLAKILATGGVIILNSGGKEYLDADDDSIFKDGHPMLTCVSLNHEYYVFDYVEGDLVYYKKIDQFGFTYVKIDRSTYGKKDENEKPIKCYEIIEQPLAKPINRESASGYIEALEYDNEYFSLPGTKVINITDKPTLSVDEMNFLYENHLKESSTGESSAKEYHGERVVLVKDGKIYYNLVQSTELTTKFNFISFDDNGNIDFIIIKKQDDNTGEITFSSQDMISKAELTDMIGSVKGIAPLDDNGKIYLEDLPDVILGQLVYGGTVTYTEGKIVATLSTNAKTKLNIMSDTINLENLATSTTNYGWQQCEGLYFIAKPNNSFAFANSVYYVGDWLVATASNWSKIQNTDAVVSVNGQTGNVVLTQNDVGLGNVDNTSDTEKPVSTAQANAIKVVQDTVDKQISVVNNNITDINTKISAINTSVGTINNNITTINGDISTINTNLDKKVDKIEGKQLSTEDFTSDLKTKLEGLDGSGVEIVEGSTLEDMAKYEKGSLYYTNSGSDSFTANELYLGKGTSIVKINTTAVATNPAIKSFSIASPSNLQEVGATANSYTFSYSLKKPTSFTSLKLYYDGTEIYNVETIKASETISNVAKDFSFSTIGTKTFNLKGVYGSTTLNANSNISIVGRQYIGVLPSDKNADTMTSELLNSNYTNVTSNTDALKTYLQTSRVGSVTLNLGDENAYVWFIIPSNMTISKMISGGFDFPFSQQSGTLTMTNSKGSNVTMKVYRSSNQINGSVTISIS